MKTTTSITILAVLATFSASLRAADTITPEVPAQIPAEANPALERNDQSAPVERFNPEQQQIHPASKQDPNAPYIRVPSGER